MAKLVDPRNPKANYRTPMQRFVCPLERDAIRKRGLSREIQNHPILAEPRYSCPAPQKNGKISLFSVRFSQAENVRNGRRGMEKSLTLTEEKGLNLSLERCEYSVKLFLAEESGAREVRLDGTVLLRVAPSIAVGIMTIDPEDKDIYLVGSGTELVRQATFDDIRDYALDSTALFMLGEYGLFRTGEFKSVTICWA